MDKTTNVKVKPENVKLIQHLTYYSLAVNLSLSVFKLIVGIIGSSNVVVADAVHSLSDAATDSAILFGVKFWSAPPDKKHPYGHLRIETIVSAIIGLTLVVVAIGIGYNAITTFNLSKSEHLPLLWVAISGPIISVVAKEILFRWNIRVGKRIKSPALIANAWEHRSDVVSSIAAILAIGAILIDPKLAFVDNIGAIIVAVLILKFAWNILVPAFSELTEAGASEKIQKQILEIATNSDHVKAAHAIRTRKTGSSIHVDLHVLVDGNMSVTKGHEISEIVQKKLIHDIPEIIDVVVHIEPYKPK